MFVFSAYKYHGFEHFFYGVVVCGVVVAVALALSLFIKKDKNYYDRKSD
tara:strand:- start:327 stop:473 length:147 start_codon:yes stop_codon:yes gene_type:complete